MEAKPLSKPIVITGIGSVPSFKNSKMLTRGKLITDPKKQKWMQRAIRSIEFQLLSVIPINAGETLTAQQARSWIASSLPLDDSRQIIPQIFITASDCDKGQEGATITIEQL